MKSRFFSMYEATVLKRPAMALIFSLLVIGWLSTHIVDFKLDASADSLVLEGDQSLKYYREISKRYASEDFLLITYHPHQDLLSDQSLNQISLLRDELSVLEGVSTVVSILDVPLLNSPAVTVDEISEGDIRTLMTPGVDKTLVRKELLSSPLYKKLLISEDGQTTAIQVNLKRDEKLFALLNHRETLRENNAEGLMDKAQLAELAFAENEYRQYLNAYSENQNKLVETVREIIDPYKNNAQIFLGGVPMITADMISFVKSDLLIFGTGIAIFIIVTLSIIFRRLLWVVLPLITCGLSVAFMMGVITWLDWRMTVISSNFVAILLIITLSMTIHLVVRYRELLSTEPELSQQQLVRKTSHSMIKPCVYTTLTTVVAFASLVVSGIRPVIDFGWMMTVGVTAALIIVFIVLPATLLLLKKPDEVVSSSSGVPITLRFAAFTEKYGKLILFIAFLLTLTSFYGISRLEVENRFIDYFDESTEIYQGMEVIDEQLGGTIPLEVIIDADLANDENDFIHIGNNSNTDGLSDAAEDDFEDDFEDGFEDDFADDVAIEDAPSTVWFNKAGLGKIEAVHDYLDSLDETGKVLSLATSYKLLKQLTSGIDDIQLALIKQKLPEDVRGILIDPYLRDEIGQTRISVRVMETSKSLKRAELLQNIKQHLIHDMGFKEEQVHLTGMLVLYNNMLQSLYRSQILTLGAVFIAIIVMFTVFFKSSSMALLAIAPNLLAAGIVLGGMGLLGIPLDIMTVTIAAISIGIGVDDTIHYVHRFTAEFEKDRNYLATMYRCHGSIGKAMYYTSVVIIVGFSILTFSNFTPSIYFGLLTGTAMIAALIGALLLLPQLLITFKPLGPEAEPTAVVKNNGSSWIAE